MMMRDLLMAVLIPIIGFWAGIAMLHACAPQAPREGFNWSQQALRDPAQDGCPGQYHEYGADNQGQFLISCWGKKESIDANDSIGLGNSRRDVRGRMDNTCDSLKEYER